MWVGLAILKRVIARTATDAVPVAALAEIPTDAEVAALIALRASAWAGNALSARQLEARFGLSRAQSTKVRQAADAGANGHPVKSPGDNGTFDAVS
jgi:ribosomal protein S3